MKAIIKRLLLVLLLGLMLARPDVWGQSDVKPQSVSAPDDRSDVRLRQPSEEQLARFRTNRDYQYDQEAPPPENPLARFFNWLFRWIGRLLNSPAYQYFWQYVLLAVIAGAIAYLLTKAEIVQLFFTRKEQPGALDYENQVENIHDINFDAAIAVAVEQRSFRLATRLLFLQTLKRLTDAALIRYTPDKTNRQYVYELEGRPFQAEFDGLVRQFDFIWYGNFPIDDAQFGQLRRQFGEFTAQLARVSSALS